MCEGTVQNEGKDHSFINILWKKSCFSENQFTWKEMTQETNTKDKQNYGIT